MGCKPIPVTTAPAEGLQRNQDGGAAQPRVGFPDPAVQHGVGTDPALEVQSLSQGTDDVDSEGIHQVAHPGCPDEPLNTGQVRVPQHRHPGLQENHGSEAALEDRNIPQLGAESRDLIMRQSGVTAQCIPDRSPYRAYRRAVILKAVP